MKATSIEQIREHLARGGRVVSDEGESVWKVVEYLAVETCNGGMIVPSQFDEKEWNLLPLEEKEPDVASRCLGYCPDCDNALRETLGRAEPVDHGTQMGPASYAIFGEQTQKTAEQALSNIHLVTCFQVGSLKCPPPAECEEQILKAFDNLTDINEKLMQRIEELEAELAALPDGTQKGQEEIRVVGPQDGTPEQQAVRQRIRTRLLHGQWPEMTDLLAWWEATTGERIEWGKRCERCDGSGRVKRHLPIGYDWITCLDCNGSGYSVRPTWMGSEKE